jgi:hypothetical protein
MVDNNAREEKRRGRKSIDQLYKVLVRIPDIEQVGGKKLGGVAGQFPAPGVMAHRRKRLLVHFQIGIP